MSESEPTDAPLVQESTQLTPSPTPSVGWAVPDAAPNAAPDLAPDLAPEAAPLAVPDAAPGAVPHFGQGLAAAQASFAAVPAPRKPKRKRVLWILTAVVAVLGLAAAGVVALMPGRTGNSAVIAVHCQPSSLATCLIKAPAGAVLLSTTGPWSQAATPSAELYGANITENASGVGADSATLLSGDGLHKIVHTDWNAVDGNNVDLVVLQFDSQKGAAAWNSTRAAEIMAAYPGQAVTIPGDTAAKAFAATKADPQGTIEAAYSTVLGNLVLNVNYSSPNRLAAQDLETWAGTELASLRTAPAAAADPADVAPGTEQVACTRLSSCLAPMPSGGEHWTSPTDKLWVSGSTLTPSQYVKLGWENKPASQAAVLSNLSSDGVTAIAHQDWAVNNAYQQADIYLVQTITASGASRLDGTNFGEPDWSGSGVSGVSYTIPGEPNAQAWYTNKADSGGFIEFYFTSDIGNVIVEGWLFFYGSFDSGTANKWAQSELNLVNGKVSTQPMGLFPLTAPTLPAPSQGTCPASGSCLLPLPAGASDTTASSFQVSGSLTALAYTAQYDAGSSSDVATWLNSDGLKSADHRSWTAANGAAADAVLLKYGKPAEARAAAQLEYGVNAAGDRVCTAAALPNSLCLATPVSTSDLLQKETVWVLAWKGDYEVSISVTLSNGADVADAYTWAQQQLQLLPAS